MPDGLQGLIAALSGKEKEIYEDNPWTQAAAGMRKQDYLNPRASIGRNLAAALIGGLTGGLMKGYGEYSGARDYDAALKELDTIGLDQDKIANSRHWASQQPSLAAQRMISEKEAQDDALRYGAWTSEQQKAAVSLAQGQDPGQEGWTALASDPRTFARASELRGQNAIMDRFGQKRQDTQAQLGVPGYEFFTPYKPTATEAAALREQYEGTLGMVDKMQQMAQTLDNRSFFDIMGQDAAMLDALRGKAMNAGRIMSNSGANFTATEQKFINDAVPALLSANPGEALRRVMMGRDQAEFARAMGKLAKEEFDLAMLARGARRLDRPFEAYPQELLQPFQTYIAQYQQARGLQPQAPQMGGRVALPQPGQTLQQGMDGPGSSGMGGVMTRTTRDGRTVRVRPLGGGKYEVLE